LGGTASIQRHESNRYCAKVKPLSSANDTLPGHETASRQVQVPTRALDELERPLVLIGRRTSQDASSGLQRALHPALSAREGSSSRVPSCGTRAEGTHGPTAQRGGRALMARTTARRNASILQPCPAASWRVQLSLARPSSTLPLSSSSRVLTKQLELDVVRFGRLLVGPVSDQLAVVQVLPR